MNCEHSLGSDCEPTISTEYQDERIKRFVPQAISPRAPVPPTAAGKRRIRAAAKTVAAKHKD
jgi:hypothetical protein